MGFLSSIGNALGAVGSLVTGGNPLDGALNTVSALIPGMDTAQGLLSFLGQNNANKMNRDIVNQQMQFQQYNSNTAYQRATADMRAAGLNPMLAYAQGGASTPSGASTKIEDAITPGLTTARNASLARSQIQQQAVQNENIKSQTATNATQAGLNQALKVKAAADAALSVTSAKNVQAQTALTQQNTAKGMAEANAKSSMMGRGLSYVDRVIDTVNPFSRMFKE